MGLLNSRRKNKMGRMYSKGKGIARRCLPYRKAAPSWVQISSNDLVEQIVKLAKKGSSPSQIGVTLRDSHGIPQVKSITGSKILRILKKGRSDRDAKFRLILTESRIHRLARYYRNVKSLPPTWRYQSKKADTLI